MDPLDQIFKIRCENASDRAIVFPFQKEHDGVLKRTEFWSQYLVPAPPLSNCSTLGWETAGPLASTSLSQITPSPAQVC